MKMFQTISIAKMFVLLGANIFPQVHGAEGCGSGLMITKYPQTLKAVNEWEISNGSRISPTSKEVLLTEYCEAANDLIHENRVSSPGIESVAKKVVYEYMERQLDNNRQARSIGAILRSEFNSAGFSRPQLKRMTKVSIMLEKIVDSLSAGSDVYPVAQSLILPIGRTEIKALLGGKPVCIKLYDLKPNVTEVFKC